MDISKRSAIHGVNLGSWLLLEKWITPSVFEGTTAKDEYTLCQQLGEQKYRRLKDHRDTFITIRDFAWLAGHGITAVRIPIGYWIFEDADNYIGCLEYLDRAFEWAAIYNMKVLIDLHGAPGSQNGNDHSGRSGPVGWPDSPLNKARSLQVIDRLSQRYGKLNSLLGIEFMNEPSRHIAKKVLIQHYQEAHKLASVTSKADALMVMADAFQTKKYAKAIAKKKMTNSVIDLHLYQVFTEDERTMDLAAHVEKTLEDWVELLDHTSKKLPAIVGEWSIALDGKSLAGMNEFEKTQAYRAYAAAQLLAFEHSTGWFYWTYKTENGGGWSFRDSVEKGLLPNKF